MTFPQCVFNRRMSTTTPQRPAFRCPPSALHSLPQVCASLLSALDCRQLKFGLAATWCARAGSACCTAACCPRQGLTSRVAPDRHEHRPSFCCFSLSRTSSGCAEVVAFVERKRGIRRQTRHAGGFRVTIEVAETGDGT